MQLANVAQESPLRLWSPQRQTPKTAVCLFRCQPDKVVGKQVGTYAQRVKHVIPYLQQQLRILVIAIRGRVSSLICSEFQQHWETGKRG